MVLYMASVLGPIGINHRRLRYGAGLLDPAVPPLQFMASYFIHRNSGVSSKWFPVITLIPVNLYGCMEILHVSGTRMQVQDRVLRLQSAMVVFIPVSYTHLRAHETVLDLVCRLLLEKKKKKTQKV